MRSWDWTSLSQLSDHLDATIFVSVVWGEDSRTTGFQKPGGSASFLALDASSCGPVGWRSGIRKSALSVTMHVRSVGN